MAEHRAFPTGLKEIEHMYDVGRDQVYCMLYAVCCMLCIVYCTAEHPNMYTIDV